ncbi:hypothetical protein EK21DRAFT_111565 [Setomelanomma holmii]|uniref:DUF7587 domain-containing protein n=1 Tax=Setomelanomma holmii TaxID=210430 RepID=A0A9P4HA74_9PLEO|nr:hypothetical protein EK21DRAFT_111565 [Setomelanomma holmii]
MSRKWDEYKYRKLQGSSPSLSKTFPEMLSPIAKEPITGERKLHFEDKHVEHVPGLEAASAVADLRQNHVPRILFRAWSRTSGGGSDLTINTTTAIVPHAYMPRMVRDFGPTPKSIYEIPESELRQMTILHFARSPGAKSGYSSCASSLHLVLCYAKYLRDNKDDEAHIAVIDTNDLDDEVYVWHVPHLIPRGNHEYLAYGCIRGNGYRAVGLRELERNGLMKNFPELARPTSAFGKELRAEMFREADWDVLDDEWFLIQAMASLFGNLY